jgi:sugar lactone lactonase YvrE
MTDSATSTNGSPRLTELHPRAAMPGGEVQVLGTGLAPSNFENPAAFIGDTPAPVTLSRAERVTLRIPPGSISGNVLLRHAGHASNSLPLRVAVPIAEDMHPVSSPVADDDGNIYVVYSGERGEAVRTSVFCIDAEYNIRPYASGILNATGLALDPERNLYVSSRHEGTIYRIAPSGAKSVYAEGMGLATGLAMDPEGNLFCGDRSGTIFKIAPDRQIFVFATLEASVAAFHLCLAPDGILYVTAPTTSSYDTVFAIDAEGNTRTFYAGLGRPQGLALAPNGDLYVAASLHGSRGIVSITPQGEASLVLSGPGIVGLTFLPDGSMALATHDAVYHLAA